MSSSSYPTQEDELRAKEAEAEEIKRGEESKFITIFNNVSMKNNTKLPDLATIIVNNFNNIMTESRSKPYQRQEDLMMGLKKLFEEQINVIEAQQAYTSKINPSTTMKEKVQ
jgi:hypothetical protein